MQYWITACNKECQVIFNVAQEFANLGDALAYAIANIPAEYHKEIIITDMDNNNLYPCEVKEGEKLFAYIGNWNKRKQCFPVRITVGMQNQQWMNGDARAKTTVVYTEEFKHSAQAKAYAMSLGATIEPGWD